MRKALFVVIRYLKVKRRGRLSRVTMLSFYAPHNAFEGLWDYDMVGPSVWVQSRVPSFKEKSLLVIDLKNKQTWRFQSPCFGWNGGHGLQL